MKRISIITGLAYVTGFSSYANIEVNEDKTEITVPVMHCCVDGNSVGKRYTVNYKGKRYVTCSKECACELKKRLRNA